MTLMLLWDDYRADHDDRPTYAYSQFRENCQRFARQLKRSAPWHAESTAG